MLTCSTSLMKVSNLSNLEEKIGRKFRTKQKVVQTGKLKLFPPQGYMWLSITK